MKIDPNMVYKSYQNIQNLPDQKSQKGSQDLLKEGQVIKGEIVDANTTGVKIKLSDGQILEAKMSGATQFSIGDQVTFIVKESTIEQLVLSPLLDEASQSSEQLSLILKNANFPVTVENQNLLKQLIENNMPIDDKSLKEFMNLVKQFPETSPKQIVFMLKHQIPVTGDNINHLAKLENNESLLLKGIASFTDDMSRVLAGKNPEVMTDTTSTLKSDPIPNDLTQSTRTPQVVEDEIMTLLSKDPVAIEFQKGIRAMLSDQDNQLPSKEALVKSAETIKLGEVLLDKDVTVLNASLKSLVDKALPEGPITEAQKELVSKLHSFESLTLKDLQVMVKEGLMTTDQLRSFLGDIKEKSAYTTMVKSLLLSKEQLSDGPALKNYFKVLDEKMTQIIANNSEIFGAENSKVVKEATDIKSSVQFLNALNQDFSLLQLPMFLNEQLMNSELYVMRDKKRHHDPSKPITALIRLDLLNLGHTDIYVKKTGRTIDVQFFMSDTTQIDVVKESVYELHNMLNKKGFNVSSATVNPLQEAFDVVNDFFEDQDVKSSVTRYSFDMRA